MSCMAFARIVCCGVLVCILEAAAAQPPNPGPRSDQDPTASQEATIRVDVDLVNVYFTVKTKKGGQLIPNLEKNDFTVFEDGKEQTIQRFSRETDLPLTLGLLIDISASQESLIDIERQAASQFFSSVIRPKGRSFSDLVREEHRSAAGLHQFAEAAVGAACRICGAMDRRR